MFITFDQLVEVENIETKIQNLNIILYFSKIKYDNFLNKRIFKEVKIN